MITNINRAKEVGSYLKGLANPHRLLILCQLAEGEKSVTELIMATGLMQTSMSQHLLKLRKEKIVTYRRDHRTLYYSLLPGPTREIMNILYLNFCKETE